MTSKRVNFDIHAKAGSEVYLAGTFNSWDATRNKLTERSGFYNCTLLVPKGRHEYKFVVNGVWCVDPKCQEWVSNGSGSLNSVITVG